MSSNEREVAMAKENVSTRSKYRLGLDMGTNSIGWAAVNLDDDDQPSGVLGLGVRIFPDGRNPKDGSSLAVSRRLPRGQRRRRDRYLLRRSDLMRALVESGLMPSDEGERKALESLDPYALRERAIDERPLTPQELGRALFHLVQRRGFKSNRKAGGADDSEAKKTLGEINELRKRIRESGARTLGEFLARLRRNDKPVRARPGMGLYPDRAMYEEEFDAIQAAQAPHHSLTDGDWRALRKILFRQRPLKPVDQGWCQLEPGEKRAANALPVAQEFRMLQEVNNLKMRVGAEPERPLDEGERKRVLERLRTGLHLDLKKPTRGLRLPPGAKFNLAAGGRKEVKGDETVARLIKRKKRGDEPAQELFGDRWLTLPLEQRNEIVKFLLNTEDPKEVWRKARQEWGLDDAQATALSHVALPAGYSNLSEKAMRKLIQPLEKGLVYSEAVLEAGYPHHSDFRNAEAHARLPHYGEVLERDAVGANPKADPDIDGEPARDGRIGNPTVHIGLNQLRRVVNRLIGVYGKPEDIVVELARDLKMNREQKQNLQRQQREGGERNMRFTETLESEEITVTPETLRKLRLWEEQGDPCARVCPYTGTPLSFSMVVSENTEVDHILPFSKTLDDSMANKVVCVAGANRYKGDRSPFEAFGHNPEGYDYQDIRIRASKLRDNKRWRFEPNAMDRFEDTEEFLGRQLNETRYLSRTARTYLAHLYDEKTEGKPRVRAVPGRMTALLRRGWGLEGMLRADEAGEIMRKQRDDHRHHAIDAFVVANTTQGLLQRFARASGSQSEQAEERLAAIAGDVPPWHGFHRNQLKPFLDNMVVSYKPDSGTRGAGGKTTGQLHNDTAYGLVEFVEGGPSKVVVRKKLSDFKKRSELEAVRDPALKEALKALWDRVETDGGKPADFAYRAETTGVPLNGRNQAVRRVRVCDNLPVVPITDSEGKQYKGYKPDSNEFADIWEMRDDGSWKIVAVPTFYANQPDFDIERFRPRTSRGPHKGKPDPRASLIMRIYKKDMCALDDGSGSSIVQVRKFGNDYLVLDPHNEANVDGRERRRELPYNSRHRATQLKERNFRKVRVDEIGRVNGPGAPSK